MADLEKLDKAILELEKQSNELKDFNSTYAEIASLKKDLLEILKILQDSNKDLSKISTEVGQRLDDFQKKIDEIYKDSKAFQKELDSSIVTRLEKHKSDIQVEIRNEGIQIQRSFETSLSANFSQLESKFRNEFEKQVKQLNTLKIMNFLLIAISIGLAVGLYIIK